MYIHVPLLSIWIQLKVHVEHFYSRDIGHKVLEAYKYWAAPHSIFTCHKKNRVWASLQCCTTWASCFSQLKRKQVWQAGKDTYKTRILTYMHTSTYTRDTLLYYSHTRKTFFFAHVSTFRVAHFVHGAFSLKSIRKPRPPLQTCFFGWTMPEK